MAAQYKTESVFDNDTSNILLGFLLHLVGLVSLVEALNIQVQSGTIEHGFASHSGQIDAAELADQLEKTKSELKQTQMELQQTKAELKLMQEEVQTKCFFRSIVTFAPC